MIETFLNIDIYQRIVIIAMLFGPFFLFIYFFVKLKDYMRIGHIDMWHFFIFYGASMAITFLGIFPKWLPDINILILLFDGAGIVLGLPAGVYIFNIHNPQSIKYIFLALDNRKLKSKLHYYFVYEKSKELLVVEYESPQTESTWNFLKRMFGMRKKLIFNEKIRIVFEESGINKLFLVQSVVEKRGEDIRYEIRGGEEVEIVKKILWKIRYITYVVIDPLPSMTLDEYEYMANFDNYEKLNTIISELYKRLMIAEQMGEAKQWENTSYMIAYFMRNLKGPIQALKKQLAKIQESKESKKESTEKKDTQEQLEKKLDQISEITGE